jgi:hypothetical protein
MIKTLSNEKWKEINFPPKGKPGKRYFISNLGRLGSSKGKFEEATILRTHTTPQGYVAFSMRVKGHNKKMLVHREVAKAFLGKPGGKKEFVIHLDYKKSNNKVKNLKWADKDVQKAHEMNSPAVIKARLKRLSDPSTKGHKLTLAKAKELKKKILDKNRKVPFSKLAAQYKVSEMQVYRIKRGELWKRVKV